jgi:protein tyrosine phosphatase (PTP) superfamily phosphohydrolase (DUF442 family)
MRRGLVTLFLLATAAGCGQPAATTRPATEAVEAPGLHNVYRITDKLLSGSSPDDESGFASLQQLGVKTIISVDGMRPNVELAHKYGMRYVHIPIGYDGVPREAGLRLARAVRDLQGLVYLHCHHGKHRGPAAAAVVHLCLDECCPVEQALAELKRAGTDPRYVGLYAAARYLTRPSASDLDALPAEFPEVAEVAALAQLMVQVDERWEHLKQVRSAGWQKPPSHPDIDPPHEAALLGEHYREAARLPDVEMRPNEMSQWLTEAEQGARELEDRLRRGTVNATAAEEAFQAAAGACSRCHARYRDVPQTP